MDNILLLKSYKNSAKRIASVCEGISEEEAKFRPYDKANCLAWEVGHLVFFRNTVIKLLNPTEKLESLPNEKDMFGYGSQPERAGEYPTLTELVALINQRGERMYELLAEVSQEHLATESPMKIPNLGVTVGQQVFGFLFHEANHWGEMNIIKTIVQRLR